MQLDRSLERERVRRVPAPQARIGLAVRDVRAKAAVTGATIGRPLAGSGPSSFSGPRDDARPPTPLRLGRGVPAPARRVTVKSCSSLSSERESRALLDVRPVASVLCDDHRLAVRAHSTARGSERSRRASSSVIVSGDIEAKSDGGSRLLLGTVGQDLGDVRSVPARSEGRFRSASWGRYRAACCRAARAAQRSSRVSARPARGRPEGSHAGRRSRGTARSARRERRQSSRGSRWSSRRERRCSSRWSVTSCVETGVGPSPK